MSTVPNMSQPMFPGGMPQMAPSAVSSVPVSFSRAPPGPTVTRAPSPQGADSELSPDDQQQAQLLMQVCFFFF